MALPATAQACPALSLSPAQALALSRSEPGLARHSLEFALAAALALLLALHLPLAATVFSLIAFGLLHTFFELRYVIGRFGALLERPFLDLLVVGLTLIAATRLLQPGGWGAQLEILVGYGLLAAALAWGWRGRPLRMLAWLGPLAGLAALSLAQPDYHFVVLAHLHNVVPLFFLWEWSRRARGSLSRRLFLAVQLGWALAIPGLILLGLFDRLVTPDLAVGSALGGGAQALAATYTPPAWRDGALPLRFLTVFAFLQVMHYVVWCAFIPRVGRAETARFERLLGDQPLVRGRRLTALAGVAAIAVAALLWSDYQLGRTVYGALASYHAYLEYPIMLVFCLTVGRRE
jgi:hypothetical protein